MRIEIKPSARNHGITGDEIRALIAYPALRLPIAARRAGALPVLHIGPAIANQPWIEVIADHIDPAVAEVFHAMMLRPATVQSTGIDELVDPDYGPQRA